MHSYHGEVGITHAPHMRCTGTGVEKPMCGKGVPQIPSQQISPGHEIRTNTHGVIFSRVLQGPTSHPAIVCQASPVQTAQDIASSCSLRALKRGAFSPEGITTHYSFFFMSCSKKHGDLERNLWRFVANDGDLEESQKTPCLHFPFLTSA